MLDASIRDVVDRDLSIIDIVSLENGRAATVLAALVLQSLNSFLDLQAGNSLVAQLLQEDTRALHLSQMARFARDLLAVFEGSFVGKVGFDEVVHATIAEGLFAAAAVCGAPTVWLDQDFA